MDAAHQYFEVDVPHHLKATELMPIVVAGEASCCLSSLSAQLCGAELYDGASGPSATSTLHNHSPLRSRLGGSVSAGATDTFNPRRWCPRVSPQLYFHPTCHFATAASMFQRQQHSTAAAAMAAHMLVASHTHGVGSAGPRTDAAALVPLLLLPHATVVWNTRVSSWQTPATALQSLCLIISASRVANAHLTSAHPHGWEARRSLLLVIHDDGTNVAGPPLLFAALRQACTIAQGTATVQGEHSDEDEEERYQQLVHHEVDLDTEGDGSSDDAARARSLNVLQLLASIPRDQRQLLEEAFGSIEAVTAPRGLTVPSAHAMRFGGAVPGHSDAHRALVERIIATATCNLLRTRHTATTPAAAENIVVSTRGTSTTQRAPTTSTSAAPAVLPSVGLPTALFLSRYFAECAVRVSNTDIYQMPCVAGGHGGDRKSTSSAAAVLLKRLQAEFAVQDALSDLERVIVQNLATNTVWLQLVQQHGAAPTSANAHPALTAAATASPSTKEANGGHALSSGASPVASAAPAASLEELCHAESERIFLDYFSVTDSDPRIIAEYRTASEALIEDLKRDAARRSAEAQRVKLQQKLLERLDAVAPLLEKLLANGRFVRTC